MGVTSTAIVGRLGATALGAVGLANILYFVITVLGLGITMGLDPLISQAFGAGDAARARSYLWQGTWLALVCGAVLSVPVALAPALLPLFGIEDATVTAARTYLLFRLPALVPFLLFYVQRSYLQAAGRARALVMAVIAGNVTSFSGTLLLVFGGSALPAWLGPLRSVPALGIAGAGIAAVLAIIAELMVAMAATAGLPTSAAVSRLPRRADMARALRVGFPVGLHSMAEVAIFALVGLLAGRLGRVELAAHQVALTLASLSYTMAAGMASAGSVRVGRAIGARDASGARRAGFVALAAGACAMGAMGFVFATAGRPLARIMTDAQEVIAVAVPLLLVAAVFQVSDGAQAVAAGILRGAGDTRFTLAANLGGYWLVGLPVAALLAFRYSLGVVGLWWGLCAGLTAVAATLCVRFHILSSRPIAPLEPVTRPRP